MVVSKIIAYDKRIYNAFYETDGAGVRLKRLHLYLGNGEWAKHVPFSSLTGAGAEALKAYNNPRYTSQLKSGNLTALADYYDSQR